MSNTYKKDLEKTAVGILTSAADPNSYDVRDGSTTSIGDDRIERQVNEEVDGCYYGAHVEGALECLEASDASDDVTLELTEGSYTRTELLTTLAQKVYEQELRSSIEEKLNDIGGVWAVVIADTCVDMEYHENGDKSSPNGTHYWYTYRNQEVACPKCYGGEFLRGEGMLGKALMARCPCCEGSGYVTGEAFTVMRWKAPNVVLQHVLDRKNVHGSVDEPDEAYGRMQTALGEPIEVRDYDPEHDTTGGWRWKHDMYERGPLTQDELAGMSSEEQAEYALIEAARAAGVL